jgi:hypothetical protein
MTWLTREAERITSGEYIPTPWVNEPWAAQGEESTRFTHLSLKAPGEVAYTKNADEGTRDIQRRVKAGKYLKRFFGDILTAPQIAEWANRAAIHAKLTPTTDDPPIPSSAFPFEILTSSEAIVEAYQKGPYSCVSWANGGYLGEVHPASIYGLPGEIACAVARAAGGKITGRVLCCPRLKTYGGGAYGNTDAVIAYLKKENYKSGNFIGAELRAIWSPKHSQFIGPPIDNHAYGEKVFVDGQVTALRFITSPDYMKLKETQRLTFGYFNGLTRSG